MKNKNLPRHYISDIFLMGYELVEGKYIFIRNFLPLYRPHYSWDITALCTSPHFPSQTQPLKCVQQCVIDFVH